MHPCTRPKREKERITRRRAINTHFRVLQAITLRNIFAHDYEILHIVRLSIAAETPQTAVRPVSAHKEFNCYVSCS